MRRRDSGPLAAAIWLAGSLVAPPSEAQPAPSPGVPAGTRGVALTVLEGTAIEEIPVRFLGRLRDAIGPGLDLYLVRLEGPRAEAVGVAAGMSGSPVFVDGAVVGALSYRFGVLPNEPVAGVTPFEDLLDASRATSAGPYPDATTATRLATPVVLGGVAGPLRDLVVPELEKLGMIGVPGGSAGEGSTTAGALRPGSAVGVQLLRGDASVSAVGTVSWVQGNEVYAFGHPFLGRGRVEMPMAGAEVVHTLSALGGSVKLANIGPEIGVILEDRLSGVVGRTGQRAGMIPVEITVVGSDYGTRAYGFEVVRVPELTPVLVATAVGTALLRNTGFNREVTLRGEGEITLRGLPGIPVRFAFTGEGDPHPAVRLAVSLQRTLERIYRHPFERPHVQSVKLDLSFRDGAHAYRVESVLYDRAPAREGEPLRVTCVLRGRAGETLRRSFALRVPVGVVPGSRLFLAVGAPDEVERALGQPLSERLHSARSLAALARALGDSQPQDRLSAVLYESAPGAVSHGFLHDDLPPTAAHLLRSPGFSGTARPSYRRLAVAEEQMDGPVGGGIVARIEVTAPGGSGREGAP